MADAGTCRCHGADVEGSMDVGHLVAAMAEAADASQQCCNGAERGSVGAAPMIVDYHK